MFEKFRTFHFVGVGGVGMSGIAEILLRQGYHVSGSDQNCSELVKRLQQLGARIEIGHRESNLGQAQAVVYSSAIPPSNPELEGAKRLGLPLVHRAEMLAELMRFKKGITITGTHGKTTTTSMVAAILVQASLDPTVVVGARVPALDGNARLGAGDYFVAEADESDRSFLRLHPTYSVITNIDCDHMDEYEDLNDLEETFLQHMRTIPFYGKLVVCSDDPNLLRVMRNVHSPVITYGLKSSAEFCADNIRHRGFQTDYRVLRSGEPVGEIRLSLAGHHNILNSLGATALGVTLDIPFDAIQQSLAQFAGPERRLERKGEKHGILVLDDYGHHPAEIKASLEACAQFERRILLVFQPHRFTRTLHLREALAHSFGAADRLYLLDIYAAGEEPIEGVTSEQLAELIAEHRQVRYIASREEMSEVLAVESKPGDLVLTMGAGDVWKIGETFLEEEID